MKSEQKNFPYLFHPGLILRTPHYAFKSDYKAEDISLFLNNDAFLEAVYLASPVLFRECQKLKNGEISGKKDIVRITNSLLRYLSRMSSRSTPFGLFSGCSLINWARQKTSVTIAQHTFSRHTRLDMHYLCALAQKIAGHPAIRPELKYFPNTSIYTIADEIRYVEYHYLNNKRSHQISAVFNSAYLTKIISFSQTGRMLHDIADLITDENISAEEALRFTGELIDSQILVSELEPAITGHEFIYQILDTLQRIRTNTGDEYLIKVIEILTAIEQRLKDLDQHLYNPHSCYQEIIGLIKLLDVEFEEALLFQTDMSRKLPAGKMDLAIQESLAESFWLLNCLYPENKQDNLSSFAQRYYTRYEDKAMPLLEVMDAETGLGYLENRSHNVSPLIDDLILPDQGHKGTNQISFNRTSRLLFDKVSEALVKQVNEVLFTEEDFKDFSPQWDDTPPSVSALFRLVDEAENTILLENISGSSAANLLGRFTHIDKDIHELVKEIALAEQQTNPDVIFAEIIHLPESRLGNILLHTVFRDHEIPYLGKSSLGADERINSSDLMIAVKNGKIILYSKKLDKEIIPRLSTAHNFSSKALPVYQFLCDLQTRDLRSGFRFNWGSLASQHTFLPRAKYKNIILTPAQWQFRKEELKALLTATDENLPDVIAAFRKQWALPRYLVLADGDNELLIDLDNRFMIPSWLKTIRNRPLVLLKEFLYDPASSIASPEGKPFINQLIASLIKSAPVYALPLHQQLKANVTGKIIRTFTPGSGWVYYKWYCGAVYGDKILEEYLTPLVDELKETGVINQWFFIRYTDPQFHLRVRFQLTNVNLIGTCLNKVSSYMADLELNGVIWKSQIDSYRREMERYGENGIEYAESIFHADSTAQLNFLSLTGADDREDKRWIWGMKAADRLLDDFALSLQQKSSLMGIIRESFAIEFGVDKFVKTQINKKYADHRNIITRILDKSQDPIPEYDQLVALLEFRSQEISALVPGILNAAGLDNIQLENLLSSYLHMMLNRLFIADARTNEMMIYHLLDRYYQSVIAQTKNSAS
ncbi:hypothetical protein TH53_09115 [Pedobacter lusitanus]|uniref:Thiopeptide-type bacteriocin biosynthesis domain-containing protein n=1 Tax=Pedobacter lusitanus TaxID=1503925 RepID=A0A0D0GMN8_9SPHI|nr:lantibiotic dehydratase [Pedobacter lusitanus]KIO77430.1 hypothetical protein TH53_09115 [Pedobacter lusitanus]